MTTKSKPRPLEIMLPCCPKCGNVSAMGDDFYNGSIWCAGPKGESHNKVRMRKRKFVEASNG